MNDVTRVPLFTPSFTRHSSFIVAPSLSRNVDILCAPTFWAYCMCEYKLKTMRWVLSGWDNCLELVPKPLQYKH